MSSNQKKIVIKEKTPKHDTDLRQSLVQGRIWDKKGKNFEKQIVQILSSEKYLSCLQKGKNLATDDDFLFFSKMVAAWHLNPQQISKIEASSDKNLIGYLPSGGAPKTDVLVHIVFDDGTSQMLTLSCKRSKCSSVSVHQYSADVFADVLDANNVKLRRLLDSFQCCGNVRDMPEGWATELECELRPYLQKLMLWVMGGIGAEGNPETQWAQYIVSYQTTENRFSVYSVEDYCAQITSHHGAFGTPFYWTYASKHRGKSIQLKAPLL